MTRLSVLDLFAGAGGFSLGAHALTDDVWGVELDADAVATQKAYGMLSDRADITTLDPHNYADPTLHVHASPPCQSFSTAGKGEGRKHLEALGRAAFYIIIRGEHFEDLSGVPEGSLLVLEPARWIHALRPDSISMEQVRSVLPIWESYAAGLRVLGYQTWTALLYSEQYGSVAVCPLHRNEHAPLATQRSEYKTALASVNRATTGSAKPNMSVWTAAWHARDAVASGAISSSGAASLLHPVLSALPTPVGRVDAAWTSAATFDSGWTGSTAANISSLLNDFSDALSSALKSSTTSMRSEATTATTTSGSGTATGTTRPSTTATIPIESAWCGLCADIAVPQTRTRAWLGASLHREVEAPNPTHSRYYVRNPAKLDAGLRPWVSMSEALGWGMTKRGSHTVTAGGTSTGGAELFGNGARQQMAKHEERGDWSHMMQGGAGDQGRPRPVDSPAPTQSAAGTATVTDDPDNNWHGKENLAARVAGGGAGGKPFRDPGTTARRVTVEEAGILQGFPADFPWQGSKTSQYRQVGNAVNPAVAEAVLRSVL